MKNPVALLVKSFFLFLVIPLFLSSPVYAGEELESLENHLNQFCDLETGMCTEEAQHEPVFEDENTQYTPALFLTKGLTEAPIAIVEYSDFQCPFCARVPEALDRLLKKYPKKIKWEFKHFPLDIHPDAPLAHEAALAAGEQGKFWEMHDLLFANQKQLKRADLVRYAEELGLEMEAFFAALDSGKFQTDIARDKAEGARLGVRGTPTFFVNGQKLVGIRSQRTFMDLIEKELERLEPVPLVTDRTRQRLTEIATTGPAEAPVQILFFADFQSRLSARISRVFYDLLEKYPDQLRLQFKHFPMRFHRDAPLAHEAVLAAGDQGKFREMSDLIFARPKRLKKAQLLTYAKKLGLKIERFQTALTQRTYRAMVKHDIEEGKRRNVHGVPTIFINGKQIEGILSQERLKKLIEVEVILKVAQVKE